MDLSFPHLLPVDEGTLSPADMAQLIAVLGDRRAASTTALVQANIPSSVPAGQDPLAPTGGAFNAAMAARLWGWRQE